MIIVDANILLRYVLQDNLELFRISLSIIENKEIFIPNEVVAEVVYVLEKVYKVERKDIRDAWDQLMKYANLSFVNKAVLIFAIKEYSESRIDFVDALLIGYFKAEHYEIETFDKKLKNRLIKS